MSETSLRKWLRKKKSKRTYLAHSRAVIMKTFQTDASLQKRQNQRCKVRRIVIRVRKLYCLHTGMQITDYPRALGIGASRV